MDDMANNDRIGNPTDDDNSSADETVHHELMSSAAAMRQRATDLADTEGALASLHRDAGPVVRPSVAEVVVPGSTVVVPATAASAETRVPVSRSMAGTARSRVLSPTERSRHRLRVGVALAAAACIAAALVVTAQTGNRPTVESSTPLQIAAVPSASGTGPTPGAVTSATGNAVTPPTLTSATLTPVTTSGRSCTYTDPAMRAISVARTLTCPDGTRVFVEGVVVRDSSGDDWLCDEASGSGQRPCAAAGLRLIGSPRSQAGGFLGVKQGDTLLDGAGSTTFVPAAPATAPLATVPTTVAITGPIFAPITDPATTAGN